MSFATDVVVPIARHFITTDMVVGFAADFIKDYTKQLQAKTAALKARAPASIPGPAPAPAPAPATVAAPAPSTDIAKQYEEMYQDIKVNATAMAGAINTAHKIVSGEAMYKDIERMTGVPWWFIGIIHYRECDCNFADYLGNGQPLLKKTTITPVGRGPFNSFAAGAVDALAYEGYDKVKDWSIGNALYLMEKYNGMGYRNRGIASPYVWGGSTYYKSGKYVADGVFRANVVDAQLGGAVILRQIEALVPGLK
jgi:lysozyme family protein